MAHLTSKAKSFKLDNASGTLTDISGSVESSSLQHAMTIIQDTGLGDTTHTTISGLASATQIPLNGFLDSTMDGILGVLLGKHTSVTKTAQFGEDTARFYYGEFWPQDIEYSGAVDEAQTWSMTLVLQNGTLTRTSKTQS